MGRQSTEDCLCDMVRKLVARLALVTALAAPMAGCGGATPTAAPATPTSSALPSASSQANAACASVTTTTRLDQVSDACAALWVPFRVSAAPPANLLASMHIPRATVTNATGGAVSDADAQAWADGLSRAAAWELWADNNDQPTLLNYILDPSLQNPTELTDMHDHGVFDEPPACIFPSHVTVEPMGNAGTAYFTAKGQTSKAKYALVATYAPCTATVTVNGQQSTFFSFTANSDVTIQAGSLQHDGPMGDLWDVDGFGSCSDVTPPPPSGWCS